MIYEGALTDQFKEIIINELYDTGALYRSMQIYSYETSTSVYFDVQCEEYIQYHIERLNLMGRLQNLSEFRIAYEKYLQNSIEAELQEALNDLDAPTPRLEVLIPTCFILLNGV